MAITEEPPPYRWWLDNVFQPWWGKPQEIYKQRYGVEPTAEEQKGEDNGDDSIEST